MKYRNQTDIATLTSNAGSLSNVSIPCSS